LRTTASLDTDILQSHISISILCHLQPATWKSAIRGSHMCQKNTNNLCNVGYIQGNINKFKT